MKKGCVFMTVQESVMAFLKGKNPEAELDYETEIFKSGIVNSLFALELVMFVEKEFHIKLKHKDIRLENFTTINRIAALVDRLREGE